MRKSTLEYGIRGQAIDIKVEAERVLAIREKVVDYYAILTGNSKDKVPPPPRAAARHRCAATGSHPSPSLSLRTHSRCGSTSTVTTSSRRRRHSSMA